MCCGCDDRKLSRWGIFFSLGFLAGAIICIILAGVNFNLTSADFKDGKWKSLAAVEIASIIYVIAVCVLGLLTFCIKNWCVTTIFSTLLAISTLFTFAIAIFGLVAGSISKLGDKIGCDTEYSGILAAWDGILPG